MKTHYSQWAARAAGVLLALCSIGALPVHAMPTGEAQLTFAGQLSNGRFFYPVLDSGPDAGMLAVFQDPATAYATHDGFWRSLLKGAAVVAGGVAGSAAGPGGAAVGALATATVVNDINRQGPGPGRRWLISDARIYREVQVASAGNILPDVLSAAVANTVASYGLSPGLTLSFVDPAVIGVHVKDAGGNAVNSIELAQAFVLTSTVGGIAENLLGSLVLNAIGAPGNRALNETDFLDMDVGPLLTAPDGTPVTMKSTLIAGYTAVPEPGTLALLGLGLLGLSGGRMSRQWRRRQRA